MKYYKVKPEHDNTRRQGGSILVANELYTPKEIEKYHILESCTEAVEISKKRTCFIFGARFYIK